MPLYEDAFDSDTFIFSGAEDLVPGLVLSKDIKGNDVWKKNVFQEGTATVIRYRPRIERNFVRIEKIEDAGNVYWPVRAKDNIVTVFGKSNDSKLFSPAPGEEYKVFRWCIEFSYDNKGNFIAYEYKKENLDNVAPGLYEKNRLTKIAPFSNIYLKKIKYGNQVAHYEGYALPKDFLFSLQKIEKRSSKRKKDIGTKFFGQEKHIKRITQH